MESVRCISGWCNILIGTYNCKQGRSWPATSRLSYNRFHLYKLLQIVHFFYIKQGKKITTRGPLFNPKSKKRITRYGNYGKLFLKSKQKNPLQNCINNFVPCLILLLLFASRIHCVLFWHLHCKTLAGAISEVILWFWGKLCIWILPSSCSGP